MKRRKFICTIIIMLIISALCVVKLSSVNFLVVDQMQRTELNKFPFIIILSIIISLTIIYLIEKRFDFWSIFNFSWLTIFVFALNYIIISYYDYKIIDFSLSRNITNYKIEKYNDDSWIITRIIYEKDTLYTYQNPKTQIVYSGDYNLNKSRFQKFYYLTKKQ